jgi:hypothetical protein
MKWLAVPGFSETGKQPLFEKSGAKTSFMLGGGAQGSGGA